MSLSDDSSRDFRLWYGTALLLSAACAIFLAITLLSLRLLWRARSLAKTFGRRALLPYTLVLLLLAVAIGVLEITGMEYALRTTANGTSFNQLIPGRCDAFDLAIDVLYHIAIIVTDALLVYRTYLIVRKRLAVILLPALMFLGSLVLAAVADVKCASTLDLPSPVDAKTITMAWLTVSVLLNVVLTTCIVIAVWPARAAVDKRARSIIGILAESAAGYTVAGLLFIGAIAAGSDLQIPLERVFGVTAFLSSSIITFRIAVGIEYIPPGGRPSPLLPTAGTHWSNPIAEDIQRTR